MTASHAPSPLRDSVASFTAVLELSHPRLWIRYSPHRVTPTEAPLLVDGRRFDRIIDLTDDAVGGLSEMYREHASGIDNGLAEKLDDEFADAAFVLESGRKLDEQLRLAGFEPLGDWRKAPYELVSFPGESPDDGGSVTYPIFESTVYLPWSTFRSRAFDMVGLRHVVAAGFHVDGPEQPEVVLKAAETGYIDDGDAEWLWMKSFDDYLEQVRRYWAQAGASAPVDAEGEPLLATLAETFSDVDDAASRRMHEMLAELATHGIAVTGIVNAEEALGITGWARSADAGNVWDLADCDGVDHAEVLCSEALIDGYWDEDVLRPDWVPTAARAIELRAAELAQFGVAPVWARRDAHRLRILAENRGNPVDTLSRVIETTLEQVRKPRRRRRPALR